MSVVFIFPRDLPALETRLVGKLADNELVDETKKVIELMRNQNQYSFIEDCSKFVDWHSILDTYNALEVLAQSGILFKIKKAVILPSLLEAKAKIQFWVTLCINRGLNVKAFENRPGAVDWLKVPA